jgi:hypothetical protein
VGRLATRYQRTVGLLPSTDSHESSKMATQTAAT